MDKSAKRFKPACIICLQQPHITNKKELYTKLLIDQLISPIQNCSDYEAFDFCIDCVKLVEDLNQLQGKLNLILDRIKQKKTEIKIKILDTTSEIYDLDKNSFRRRAAKDFLPTVQLERIRKSQVCKEEYKHSYDYDTENVDPFPLPLEKCTSEAVDSQKLKSNLTDELVFDNSDVINSIELKHEFLYEEESALAFQPWTECPIDEDDFTTSFEMISKSENVDPMEIINSYSNFVANDDPIIETWKDVSSDDDCYLLTDEENEMPIKSSNNIVKVDNDKTSTLSNYHQIATKEQIRSSRIYKPPLSETEIAFMAIMCSKDKQLSIAEICDFILDNFPYFQSNNSHSLKGTVELFVNTSIFITTVHTVETDTVKKYTVVNDCEKFDAYRKCIHDKLKKNTLFRTIAYPDRIPKFKECLLKDSCNQNPPSAKMCLHNEEKSKPKFAKILHPTKVWKRPPLKYIELCALAIMSNQNMEMSISEMVYFILCNFPFYASTTVKDQVKNKVISNVTHCPYIDKIEKRRGNKTTLTYVVQKNEIYLKNQVLLCEKLSDKDFYTFMAFPERLPTFRRYLGSENLPAQDDTLSNGKIWPKPILNGDQLCVLSIMNSSGMVASFKDISSFIKENFPFYQMDVHPSCEVIVKAGLGQRSITAYLPPTNNTLDKKDTTTHCYFDNYMYTIKEDSTTETIRKKTAELLRSVESSNSMAYPDRVKDFLENVMTKQIDRTGLHRYFIK